MALRTHCEPYVTSLLPLVEAHREEDETVIDTAVRLLYNEALVTSSGVQSLAAMRLGVSRRVMNYWAAKYKLRPKDSSWRVDRPKMLW